MKNIKEITFKIKFNFIKYQKNKKFLIFILKMNVFIFSLLFIFLLAKAT